MTRRTTKPGALERATYRSRWRDGSVELVGGVGVLWLGAIWYLDVFWAAIYLVPIHLAAWVWIRRRVVEPRIGRVTFSLARRNMENKGNMAALLFGIGLLIVLVALFGSEIRSGGEVNTWIREWIAALPVALLSMMALCTGLLTRLTRYVAYAGVLLLTAAVATWVGWEPGPQILMAGAIITVAGVCLFARFLAGDAIPAEGVEDL